MNSADIAAIIAEKHSVTRQQAKDTVASVFAAIVDAAAKGEDTAVPGFGKFAVKHSPARQGRNPATGAVIEIAANNKLSFAQAKAAKDAINR